MERVAKAVRSKTIVIIILASGLAACHARLSPTVTSDGGVHVPLCQTTTPDWSQTVSISRQEKSPSPPGECPDGLPQGRIRIDSVNGYPENAGIFTTTLGVTSLDLQPTCTATITISLFSARVNFTAGTIVVISARQSIRDPEKDQTTTWIFRNSQGFMLLAIEIATRPAVFDRDLFSGMTLSIDNNPVCQLPGDAYYVTTHFISSGNDCAVQPDNMTCCMLWSQPYEVLVSQAYHSPTNVPDTILHFQIRAPGIIVASDSKFVSTTCSVTKDAAAD